MKKYLLPVLLILLVLGGYFLYQEYGYLATSVKNWPKPSAPADSSPRNLSPSASIPEGSDPSLDYLSLPQGFALNYFAQDVPGARSLAKNEDGSLIFVGTRSPGIVYAVTDKNLDGVGETRYTLATGLNSPNGVAYLDGVLYVAEINRILKFPNIDNSYQDNPEYQVIYQDLPSETHHGWRYLAAGPDNRLYFGIGAPCNVCNEGDPFASIASLNPDGTDFRIEARGIRNTVGITWNPADNSLWFTDNGRDLLGDNTPPDELNHLTSREEHFGYPFCHGTSVLDPQFGGVGDCEKYTSPVVELGPHVAALGLLFYRGEMFPHEYQGKIIIAEHGSWNRTVPIGYRLTTVDLTSPDSTSNYQPFVEGWLEGETALGRPVDLLELPDGSLLISDDKSGTIYRLTYSNP